MSQKKIEQLTAEQEALIPVYREKWRSIALSAEPIDYEKAKESVKEVYALIGLSQPKIVFCDSPNAALKAIVSQKGVQVGKQLKKLGGQHWIQVTSQLATQEVINLLDSQLVKPLSSQIRYQITLPLESQLKDSLWTRLWSLFYNFIQPEIKAYGNSWFDFCIEVLDCKHEQSQWLVSQLIAKNCGWIFPWENTCIICERPIKLSFDNQERLHAEGEPAIQFADGYSLYAYHGVTLPEKYGSLYPNQWQAKWLLEENNAELRRVLIQGIGYERIAEELQATQLDSFQEYSLLKIESDVDVEPIHLLKMTCPSTGFIHVLRVPPNVNSAQDAISWVNWGINPEEFSVQT